VRHAHAIELAREGVPLNVIQRQLGHRNLGVTSIYLPGIDPGEINETAKGAPWSLWSLAMVPDSRDSD
jgi:integrase